MELRCTIQQYAWDKYGQSSEVALLHSSGNPDFPIDDATPYSELWMRTHPNGPSVLKGSSQELGDWIQAHPTSLGAKVTEKFGSAGSIPVQSIVCQSSIICSGSPRQVVPELRRVIGKEVANYLLVSDEAGMQQALKNCFRSLMTCPKEMVLEKRVASLDCIMYMACSDNVVCAGLTPKYKDVETLCSMLKYSCGPSCAKRFQGIQEDESILTFCPPVADFCVAKINIAAMVTDHSLIPRDSASIFVVISGRGTAGDRVETWEHHFPSIKPSLEYTVCS